MENPFLYPENEVFSSQLIDFPPLAVFGFNASDTDGWEKIAQRSKKDFSEVLKSVGECREQNVIRIRIGVANTFECQLQILQYFSDYFAKSESGSEVVLPEEKVSPEVFAMIYEWMLAQAPLIQRRNIIALYNAATYLHVDELLRQCWCCFHSDQFFQDEHAFVLYMEARPYKLPVLKKMMLARVRSFFLSLVASQEFLELNETEVRTVLSSNAIAVHSEVEVYMAAVTWLNWNWPEREGAIPSVMETIRFSLMHGTFLIGLTTKYDCPETNRICHHRAVLERIADAVALTAMEAFYAKPFTEDVELMKGVYLKVPQQRQWISGKECKYHHCLECPLMQYTTFATFLKYLEAVRSKGKDYRGVFSH